MQKDIIKTLRLVNENNIKFYGCGESVLYFIVVIKYL